MKNYEPMFTWDKENGVAYCYLKEGRKEFYGTALCAEVDEDMKSEKTGCQIAYMRAQLQSLIDIRDNELKPGLKALNQVYYTMKHSGKFNEKSYENKMLQRQIRFYQNDLAQVKDMILTAKTELKNYIQQKDNFYKDIRNNRKKDK